MRRRYLIDTNVVVRFLVGDEPALARAAARLFDACDEGEVDVIVLPEVLAEIVFVLQSFYRQSRADIAAALRTLLTGPGILIVNSEEYIDALNRFEHTNLHFVDCVLAATAASGATEVCSFDADFRKFRDVRVYVPGSSLQ